MLGSVAISERSISDQPILISASESVSANFTKTTGTSVLFDASASMESISAQVTAAAGFIVGVMNASTEFTQTTVPIRFAAGISANVFNFTQGSA